MLDTNWLQQFQELVRLSNWRNIWLFGCNIRGEIGFQKMTTKCLGAKSADSSSYILCKILKVKTRAAQKVFNTFGQIPRDSQSCCALLVFGINVSVAPSETVWLMLIRKARLGLNPASLLSGLSSTSTWRGQGRENLLTGLFNYANQAHHMRK